MQSSELSFSCPVCGGNEYAPVFSEPRSIFSRPLFYQCGKCSLAFVDPKRFSAVAGSTATRERDILHRRRWIDV